MDRGPFEAQVTHLATASVVLDEFAIGRQLLQRGGIPERFRTFGIPADDALKVRWRGKNLSGEDLMVFPRGSELDCVSLPGFHALGLSVSDDVLQEAAIRRGFGTIEELLPEEDAVYCVPVARHALRRLALQLTRSAVQDPTLMSNPWFRVSLEEYLIEALLTAISVSQPATQSRAMARTRTRALKKALDAIADRAHEPISVTELERVTGTSGRTLRYAFEEAMGVSPVRYLQAHRLSQVYRELRGSGPREATVSEVARSWGFWHMSQFSADYQKMFGELPSETLRS